MSLSEKPSKRKLVQSHVPANDHSWWQSKFQLSMLNSKGFRTSALAQPFAKASRYQSIFVNLRSSKGGLEAGKPKRKTKASEKYTKEFKDYLSAKRLYETQQSQKKPAKGKTASEKMFTTVEDSSTTIDPVIKKLRDLTEKKSEAKVNMILEPARPTKEMVMLQRIHMASKLERWTNDAKTKIKLHNKAMDLGHTIEIREQPATTVGLLNHRPVLIVHGGLGTSIFKDLHVIDIHRQCHQKWHVVYPRNYRFERYGHTIHLVKDTLYVIGGFNGNYKYTTSAPGLYYYSFANLFYEIDLTSRVAIFKNYQRGEYPVERRNHTSTLIGDEYILLIGGIDLNDKVLGDMWIYSIKYDIWCELRVTSGGRNVLGNGMARHAATLIRATETPGFNKLANRLKRTPAQRSKRSMRAKSFKRLETQPEYGSFKTFDMPHSTAKHKPTKLNMGLLKSANKENFNLTWKQSTQRNHTEGEQPCSNIMIDTIKNITAKGNINTELGLLSQYYKDDKRPMNNGFLNNSQKLAKASRDAGLKPPFTSYIDKGFNTATQSSANNNPKRVAFITNTAEQQSPNSNSTRKSAGLPDFMRFKNRDQLKKASKQHIIKKFIEAMGEYHLFIHGGVDNDNRLFDNEVRMLVIQDNEARFEAVPVFGERPQARYDFCMSSLEQKGVFFVYGGRNKYDEVISELYMFNLENLTWRECAMKGEPNYQRTNFSMSTHGPGFILYGGINQDGFLPNKFYELRLIN